MKDRPDADMRMQECKTSQDRIVCKGGWSLKVTMFLRVHVDNLIHGTPPGNPRHIEIQSIWL
jgi:hypothetical protein